MVRDFSPSWGIVIDLKLLGSSGLGVEVIPTQTSAVILLSVAVVYPSSNVFTAPLGRKRHAWNYVTLLSRAGLPSILLWLPARLLFFDGFADQLEERRGSKGRVGQFVDEYPCLYFACLLANLPSACNMPRALSRLVVFFLCAADPSLAELGERSAFYGDTPLSAKRLPVTAGELFL